MAESTIDRHYLLRIFCSIGMVKNKRIFPDIRNRKPGCAYPTSWAGTVTLPTITPLCWKGLAEGGAPSHSLSPRGERVRGGFLGTGCKREGGSRMISGGIRHEN
jgi:hypothetical protein